MPWRRGRSTAAGTCVDAPTTPRLRRGTSTATAPSAPPAGIGHHDAPPLPTSCGTSATSRRNQPALRAPARPHPVAAAPALAATSSRDASASQTSPASVPLCNG
ncbi:hypothetical protein SEVIR_1G238540v4 [Setaria viridis]